MMTPFFSISFFDSILYTSFLLFFCFFFCVLTLLFLTFFLSLLDVTYYP